MKKLLLVTGFSFCYLISTDIVSAQITPDNTLGSESSTVTQGEINGLSSDIIENGATRGNNLFHSFSEFNVNENRGAYFDNPTGIENILTRVTGNNVSNILGTLGVLGNANLFLLNPNGIIFSKGAKLDLNGSFIGSTANSLVFNNGFEYSATNPQTPPLLTVNLPTALRFRQPQVKEININDSNLIIQPGKTLALVGGNLNLDNSVIKANGGQIELGGLTTAGDVTINNNFSLSFPKSSTAIKLGNISLNNGSEIDVTATGGGSITINAQELNLSNQSKLLAGISEGLGTPKVKANDININTTGAIALRGRSIIQNRVNENAIGNAGNINITTKSFTAVDGSQLDTRTFGQKGNAGNININATDSVLFQGDFTAGLAGLLSGAFSSVGDLNYEGTTKVERVGNGGNININAGELTLKGFSGLNSSTYAVGNSGNINIELSKNLSLDSLNGISFIATSINPEAKGKGGNLNIIADSVFLIKGTDFGSQIFSNVNGEGQGGDVNITAADQVLLDGSFIFNSLTTGAIGNSGNINITGNSISLINGSQLITSTEGIGNAGTINLKATDSILFDQGSFANSTIAGDLTNTDNSLRTTGGITVETGSLVLAKGAQINVSTTGRGNPGRINITASKEVSFDGFSDTGVTSGVFSAVGNQDNPNAIGNGGEITITANALSVTNGAELVTSTEGKGNAGNVNINVTESVSFDGVSEGGNPSGIKSGVNQGAVGNGSQINITANALSFTDKAELVSSTDGKGNAGNITLTSDSISLNNSGQIFASIESNGISNVPSNINIQTTELSLTNNSKITASSEGIGIAGNISITANYLNIDNGQITTRANNENGGNINLNVSEISTLSNQSVISATAGIAQEFGNGGNINFISQFIIGSGASEITAEAFKGTGGNINLSAEGLFFTPDMIISASSQLGADGELNVKIPDTQPIEGLIDRQNLEYPEQIAVGCSEDAGIAEGSFTYTGKGGIPQLATDEFQGDTVLEDLRPLPTTIDENIEATIPPEKAIAQPIKEARGWRWKDENKDTVIFTTNPTEISPQSSSSSGIYCGFLSDI